MTIVNSPDKTFQANKLLSISKIFFCIFFLWIKREFKIQMIKIQLIIKHIN